MQKSTETYFEIKDNSNFIRVDVLKQNFPNAELDFDKNLIECWVSAKFGMFSGEFRADLMTSNLERFKNELEMLYDNLSRTFTFESHENQVEIKISGDGIGHLNAFFTVRDHVGIGNELNGELNFDQTELAILINQLKNITAEYKVF